MTLSKSRRRRQRGIALLLTAVSMILLIPIIGLAIDVSFLYWVRAGLSACVGP